MRKSKLASCLLAVLCSFSIWGQTDRGTVTGLISDQAGSAIPNAMLELRGSETGVTYPAASSSTGNYTFSQIPVGLYELTVTAAGFKTFVRQNIRVQGAQTLGLDVQMEIGAATESVTVTSEVSLLRTESSDISTNVEAARMTTLPILPIGNGFSSSHGVRNPMAVVNLTPGTYFDPNLNVKVNGAPSNTEAVHVDGQDATNGVVTFSQAQTQPSIEGLEELSIQSSNYAPEFGQAGAGLFNYTTRSGTNDFHGTLFDYLANEALNASQPYTHTRPQLRRNNFGGNLGGPVIIPKIYNGHDKTFFFFNYEAFKEKGVITNQYPTVPTDPFRAGDLSAALAAGRPIAGSPADSTGRIALDGQIFDPASEFRDAQGRRVRLPFVNNTIPAAQIDTSARRVLDLVPRANLPGLVQNYNSPFPTDRYTSIPGIKIDHSTSSKGKFSGYYSRTATSVQYCVPLCGSDGLPDPITATRGTFIESNTIRLNYDYILTPALLLHFGAGFLRNDFKDTAPTTDFDLLGQLGIAGATIGKDGGRFPIMTGLLGNNSLGGLNSLGPAAGQVRAIENKPTFNASATYVKGSHTFKFGGESRLEGFIDWTYTNTTGNFNFNAQQSGNPYFADAGVTLNGGTVGHPFASFLLGRVNTAQITQFTQFRGGRDYWGAFAQDTWKVNRRMTVDYGLRWDFSTYSREQYGRAPAFDANVPNVAGAAGHPGGAKFEGNSLPGRCNCSFANNYAPAFGPRVGVAYQITDRTVLRAGFGISYSAYTGGRYAGAPGANKQIDAPGVGDPAMILAQGITNQGQPFTPVWPDIRPDIFPLPGTTNTPPGFTVFDQNRGRPARQTQFSIGLQHELMRSLVLEASYVGTRGAWWATPTLNEYNALRPEQLLSLYGLNILSAADRAILSAQIGTAAAGRFQNRLPYATFPRSATVAQSLRPFPQFGNLTGPGPLGNTWYDSLQAKVTKRLSHGLDLSYNFTWSKELQLGADTDGGGGQINDVFNRSTNKQFSSFSRPFWNVIAANYTTPKWGGNRVLNAAVSDWTIGAVMQYGSGQPIPVPATAQATSNLATALLRPTRADRVPGVPLFLNDLNCHCFDPGQTQVLNPAAWRDPVAGSFSPSAAYYNDYRYQRRPRETLSVGRIFRIKERVRLQIRAEFNNAFNRTQVPNPVATGYTTQPARANGVYNTGFGVIATRPTNAVTGERSGLLVGRLTF